LDDWIGLVDGWDLIGFGFGILDWIRYLVDIGWGWSGWLIWILDVG